MENTCGLPDFAFPPALQPDAPAACFAPFGLVFGRAFAVPLPVERDFVGETDFILETGFAVPFLHAFKVVTAFFGGILTVSGQILGTFLSAVQCHS